MKKYIALLLALLMVLSMAACASEPVEETTVPPATDPVEEVTQPEAEGLAAGTSWNAIEGYDREGNADSVWKYYFFDGNDSSYNPMGGYEERNDGSLCSWYPWEGCWVGLGFNADMQGYLEMNADGTSMISVLGFVAPADGKYVITGKVQNPWSQPTGLFTVSKVEAASASDLYAAGTVVLEQDISIYTEVNGYLNPTDVELKKGDVLRFLCPSTGSDWVSAYADITMHYEPTDASVYEVPEVVIPEPVVEPDPAVEGAVYTATADFSTESNDGVWVYASTLDGLTYTLAPNFNEPTDWDDDPDADATQWYSENWTGLGFNYDVGTAWLELNVSETPENGGEITALGFKAPEDGTYHLTVFTKNFWGQSSNGVVVHQNGEDIATIPFEEAITQQTIDVTMTAGEVVYIHGTSAGGWVSTYVAAFVTVG